MKNKQEKQQVISVDMLEPIDPRNFASRQRWEVETTKKVREAGEKTIGELGEFVVDAKKNNWWGAVYENGVIAPFGLANYLAELYSFQIFVFDIWPTIPTAARPTRLIDEFNEDRRAKFNFWLKTKYLDKIKHFGFPDLYAIERVHIECLRDERLKKVENK